MNGSIRTTYPTWHQPWACLGCEKHGEVIVRVTNMKQEWLRAMARQIDVDHRCASPLCPHDISTAYKSDHPRYALARSVGFKGPLVMGRPYRQGKSGMRIYAEGPNETQADVACRVKKEKWPPWLNTN